MSERFERAPQPIQPIEQPTSPEVEFSPEVLEAIMEKVEDIQKPGIGIHTTFEQDKSADTEMRFSKNLDSLDLILRNGLLDTGGRRPQYRLRDKTLTEKDTIMKEEWVKMLRTLSPAERERRFDEAAASGGVFVYITEPGHDHFREYAKFTDSITIMLDYEKLDWKVTGRKSSHRSAGEEASIKYRIAPRFFKGIIFEPGRINVFSNEDRMVVNRFKELWDKIIDMTVNRHWVEQTDVLVKRSNATSDESSELSQLSKKILSSGLIDLMIGYEWHKVGEVPSADLKKLRSDEIVDEMRRIFKDKPELLLPVYDTDGNLYWPKQMSYEEVKKFIAERDKEKPADITADTPHPNPLPVEGEGNKM